MIRLILFILATTFFQFNISFGQKINSADNDKQRRQVLGIYEYVYEYNNKDLVENHYIKLEEINGKLKGTYYGTSDDFDEAREEYLPGFFKADMHDIFINDSTINFKVKVISSDVYKKAITPFKSPKNNKRWTVGLRYNERNYFGKIYGDKIVIKTKDFDKRTFVKRK